MAPPTNTDRAPSVDEYLDGLPEPRREVVSAIRKLILRHLPEGYEESFSAGMISYCVPLSIFPDTYNGRPLSYIALASHKNYLTLYLMSLYADRAKERWFREEFMKAGKKLDMGKSCVHFNSLDDLPLGVIRKVVSGTPVKEYIAAYRRAKE